MCLLPFSFSQTFDCLHSMTFVFYFLTSEMPRIIFQLFTATWSSVFFLSDACSRRVESPSATCATMDVTQSSWTLCLSMTKGTDTFIIAALGSSLAKPIHLQLPDSTLIPTHPSPENNSESKLSPSKKSNSPTTTWTNMARWEKAKSSHDRKN